mgnify:CR=1 FL=1
MLHNFEKQKYKLYLRLRFLATDILALPPPPKRRLKYKLDFRFWLNHAFYNFFIFNKIICVSEIRKHYVSYKIKKNAR